MEELKAELNYYKKQKDTLEELNIRLKKQNMDMRQFIENQQEQVDFYRKQVLRFYETPQQKARREKK